MKKKVLILAFAAVGILGFSGSGFLNVWAEGENGAESSISDEQKNTIKDHCDTIKETLKSVQRTDARARMYLGRYFETVLSNFMIPLNVRLIENSIANNKLTDNQTNFAARRDRFNNDFISYQQALEELVNIDCKAEPQRFYDKLVVARDKRKIVNRDVTKLKELTNEQVKQVEALSNGAE